MTIAQGYTIEMLCELAGAGLATAKLVQHGSRRQAGQVARVTDARWGRLCADLRA
jgi:hypothetical protein